MNTLELFKKTYHSSWLDELKIEIINENKDWILFERSHPRLDNQGDELLHTRRILLNKKEPIYYGWQSINNNMHRDKVVPHKKISDMDIINGEFATEQKFLGHRTFRYDMKNIDKLLERIMIDCL